ncbi:hypothetical protein G6F46_014226 [Rhizopus delemar]|nr:hypothetical protein G6F46_014226 [Rhizopus delemar]
MAASVTSPLSVLKAGTWQLNCTMISVTFSSSRKYSEAARVPVALHWVPAYASVINVPYSWADLAEKSLNWTSPSTIDWTSAGAY